MTEPEPTPTTVGPPGPGHPPAPDDGETPPPPLFRPERARSAIRKGLLTAGVSVVAIGLAVVAVSQTDLGAAALDDLLTRAQPWRLVLALVAMTSAFSMMGFRWRALMPPGHRPPPVGLAAIICAGLLLNYAVPGPFGELGAAWFAHRRYRLPLADSLASGVAARLVGLITSAALAALIFLFTDLPVPEDYERMVGVAAALLGVGSVALAVLAARPLLWKRLVGWCVGRLPDRGRLATLGEKLERGVGSLADALAAVATRGFRPYAEATFWALAGHSLVILGIFTAASAFQASPTAAGVAFTYAATTAGAVALFALPGSQVGWDLMFGSLLVGTAGLDVADAVAIALVVRIQQLLVMGLGALTLTWLLRSEASSGP